MSFIERSQPREREDMPQLPLVDEAPTQAEIAAIIVENLVLDCARHQAEAQHMLIEYQAARERHDASAMSAAAKRLAANSTNAAAYARRIERIALAAQSVCQRKE